jgi:sensor histidine kinase YesM
VKHGRTRLVVGVTLAWTLAAVVVGAQNSLASTLTGAEPVPLGRAIQFAFLQFLPWIPVTLAVVALATRFPLTRERWLQRTGIHIVAAVLLAFFANVLVVLEYWMVQGTFRGFAMLMQQGSIWATLRMHVVLLIYAAILGITQSVQYYRRTRDRELHLAKLEAQLARARLEALNAQIRPHFLFNTLHTIGQLWRSGQSDDADAVLDHLGSLFHKVQGSTSRLEVPLSEELELVREYLAIEEMRFRDRLHTSVNASPAALDCLVPPLLLQPLVENAVRHGISAVSSSGRVDVTATIDGDRLFISVRDDGPGMNAATPAPGSGTGLRNTRERLEQLYGPSAQLRISTPPDGGTRVQVEIPLNGHTPARTDALRA